MKYAAETNRDIANLVKRVTGFQPATENYGLCLAFAKENFRFHSYGSTDERVVRNSFKGLIEKFSAFGQDGKAVLLEQHITALLRRPAPFSITLLIYDVLSLLLHLSHSPTYAVYESSLVQIPPGDDEPNSTSASAAWKQILIEEPLEGPHWSHNGSVLDASDDEGSEFEDSESTKVQEEARQTNLRRSPQFFFGSAASERYTSELHLIRETLFMLRGLPSPVYPIAHSGAIEVDVQLMMTHATEACLRAILEWFAAKGTAVAQARRFEDRLKNSPSLRSCRTLEALGSGLSNLILRFTVRLSKLDQCHQNHLRMMQKTGGQESASLLTLQNNLRSDLKNFEDIADFLQRCDRRTYGASNADTASVYLSELYARIVDAQCASNVFSAEVYIYLLSTASKPYFDILERWMLKGNVEDTGGEFFIVSDYSVEVGSASYWHGRHVLRESQRAGSVTPSFLEGVGKEIFVAGKTFELVEGTPAPNCSAAEPQSLHRQFVEGLFAGFGGKIRKGHGDRQSPGFVNIGIEEPLAAFPGTTSAHLPPNSIAPELPGDLTIDEAQFCLPVEEVAPAVLLSIFRPLYEDACSRLKSTFFTKYGLGKHLTTLQNVCCMTDGSVMRTFCAAVFAKMRTRILDRGAGTLDALFVEACVGSHIDPTQFEFWLDNEPTLDILDRFRMSFQVSPTICVILTPDSIEIYTIVMRFLMLVKRAKISLEGEGWRARKERQGGKIGRWRVAVRTKLSHFARSLEAFLMNAIIVPQCTVFNQRIRAANDLDEMTVIHEDFVRVLRDRCLLNNNVLQVHCLSFPVRKLSGTNFTQASKIMDHIRNALALCMDYGAMCENYETKKRIAAISASPRRAVHSRKPVLSTSHVGRSAQSRLSPVTSPASSRSPSPGLPSPRRASVASSGRSPPPSRGTSKSSSPSPTPSGGSIPTRNAPKTSTPSSPGNTRRVGTTLRGVVSTKESRVAGDPTRRQTTKAAGTGATTARSTAHGAGRRAGEQTSIGSAGVGALGERVDDPLPYVTLASGSTFLQVPELPGSGERLDNEFASSLQDLVSNFDKTVRFVRDAVAALASHGVPHLDSLAAVLAE
ncbi:Gamma-tubulin complex component 5 [Borealophlyctis nickersoniae]|nr:Gamma-tubulin complex component 5 [Borealophlyctis nickersoniae]